ncbi:class I SAM-dependent methyltransferase [Acidomonas methanolica]|uniref:Methyltransferase n=1 Tax=Acidomonas methanolica NBRC 104435 TaxID=1231351 RepID=A0A023D1C2_ACIMT|nr:methyltransferase domain-containing protein [Acidomonas methanolica]MBU2652818.1 methyltransferase domain-containing protein [Acidomonas methanolica]TCS31222.1 methyltransferase family protein [Acidomonas methanolica]GAJ27932.1 methyltransferase [Acidomonas methanolica NBRC 104435]GBQ50323.1 SAM-dependent methyltransferase [Acidomonas methanolica]GEK98531.1 putative methyltransferase YcgJ [Acidomonas methanolica NBRC 104435]
MSSSEALQASHQANIQDQFSRQAEIFAAAPELHNDDVLALLVNAADPGPTDATLDIACGPGTVCIAMARHARRSVGLDATEAMLAQARRLAAEAGVANVEWRQGDVYALPFEDACFDIVTCRFAFHHFERPADALREMARVCVPGGRILVCDAVASDDPRKAEAFNRMELLRDPSTVAFRPLATLLDLFAREGLPKPEVRFFQIPAEREKMVTRSFPADDDYDGLRAMITDSVAGDAMGMGARFEDGTVLLAYPSVVLVSVKPGAA